VGLPCQLPGGFDRLRPAGDEEHAVEVPGRHRGNLRRQLERARVAIPPQINVIGSAIFFVAVFLMLANVALQWRRQPKGAV
jgi:hypothetical protein